MFIPTCGKLKSQGVQCIICNYKKWVQSEQRTAPVFCNYTSWVLSFPQVGINMGKTLHACNFEMIKPSIHRYLRGTNKCEITSL